MKLLLDMNILLDIFLQRDPHYAASARVFTLCETGLCQGLLAAQSYATLFYLLRKGIGKEATLNTLQLVRRILETAPLGAAEVDHALSSGFKDFEDALQYQVALACGATHLLTRNPTDYPQAALPVLTPATFLAVYFS